MRLFLQNLVRSDIKIHQSSAELSFCNGNLVVTGGFHTQRASNAKKFQCHYVKMSVCSTSCRNTFLNQFACRLGSYFRRGGWGNLELSVRKLQWFCYYWAPLQQKIQHAPYNIPLSRAIVFPQIYYKSLNDSWYLLTHIFHGCSIATRILVKSSSIRTQQSTTKHVLLVKIWDVHFMSIALR